MKRRTVTMDWDALSDQEEDDDDRFFESYARMSSVQSPDFCSSGSEDDDEEFEDSRMSFASVATVRSLRPLDSFAKPPQSMLVGYDMWMSEPGDINERRRRLLQGMGLASSKDLERIASSKDMERIANSKDMQRIASSKDMERIASSKDMQRIASSKDMQRIASSKDMQRIASRKEMEPPPPDEGKMPSEKVDSHSVQVQEPKRDEERPPSVSPCPSSSSPLPSSSPSTSNSCSDRAPVMLVRSRSDGDILAFCGHVKERMDEMLGSKPAKRHTRTTTSSEIVVPGVGLCQYSNSDRIPPSTAKRRSRSRSSNPNLDALHSDGAFSSSFMIRNLDNGKEFIVNDCKEKGLWNKLRDLQTGKQLTMEEFEKSAGSSSLVKELMGRQNTTRGCHDTKKIFHGSYLSKSFRSSKKKGVALLKNIKEVATSMSGLSKEHDHKEQQQDYSNSPTDDQKAPKATSNWVKSRQHGRSYREFTALHMTQDIHAHNGSIWTIRFSQDSRFLATAGEDKVIHVWEVQECDVMYAKTGEDSNSANSTPANPVVGNSSDRPPMAEITPLPSDKRKRIRSLRRKGISIPDYVNMPETVFALSEKPICTFEGHQEDVLDLSWSKSQQLLSSSMDKTVRLWDLESKTCLKTFAHNDYVTCIQFNPVDCNYFMSGSLDAKVRIWSIPDRQVVNWIELHEMVTAASYTPDGQGAVVGSHQGNCRFYIIDDCKLEIRNCVRMRTKAQAKKIHFHSQAPLSNKITGFQFSPLNPSEVLITSTDSRIRLHNGSELIQKYRGFKNTSSQISATFSPDGRHVICPSEDSQIYIWKVEESKNPDPSGKKPPHITVPAYEYFTCKDVSVAIPWPGSTKYDAPQPTGELQSKRHFSSKRSDQDATTTTSSFLSASGRKHFQLPPLPGKKNNVSCTEEDFGQSGRMMVDPGIGATSNSFDASSIGYGESPWTSSRFESSSASAQATAWGLVIVAASLDGDIRVYQNFGLPVKMSRLVH